MMERNLLPAREDGMAFERRQLLRILSFTFGSSLMLGRGALALEGQAAAPKKSAAGVGVADPSRKRDEAAREKVTGIGGFFFRSKDPKGLGEWYEQHLGITLAPTTMDAKVWEQEAGQTVFDPFPESSKYFGDPSKVWMLNFRVRNLDKMAAQLQAAGIAIKVDSQTYPNGRFARLHDPEGNPIELWQPKMPWAAG
jgi:predicted enzyme related to lactoylglutathione lyase